MLPATFRCATIGGELQSARKRQGHKRRGLAVIHFAPYVLPLDRFHGVLAANAGLRAAIVPGPPQTTCEPADEHVHGTTARMGWARLLKRVFGIDLEHCPQRGGTLKIIAAIEEPAVIVRILTHLGLPARTPPRAQARPLSFFQPA